LCEKCLPGAFDIIPSFCFRCKKTTSEFSVCKSCKKFAKLDKVMVGTAYSSYAKKLIYQMKFVPDRTATDIIAMWIDGVMSTTIVDVVTWVPTANARVRERGFDHSKLIATSFAKRRGIKYEELLYRIGKTRQVGAEKKVREEQIKGSFLPVKPITDSQVLIVDDIITTGATLSEAAKTLKKAGAKEVYALAFAQKL